MNLNAKLQIHPPASHESRSPGSFDVAVIGGGFSGSVLAAQLLRKNSSLRIAVVDKGPVPARGIAYSTPYDCHLLNVPAGNMSALPEEPDHFLKWVRVHHDPNAGEKSFLPRALFGRYIESLIAGLGVGNGGNDLSWLRDEAVSLARSGDIFTVRLRSGQDLIAESVVLALGNLPPRDPHIPGLTNGAKRFISFAWSPAAFDELRDDASILLLGSGLTSVDMAAALDARGFRGTIHILSRHGLVPQRHNDPTEWPQFWHRKSPRTARGLLRLVRDQVRDAAVAGIDWRGVIDALRPVTHDIWLSLSHSERRRFLRHVRAYWEVHRHRIAPEIDGVISRLRADGRLHIHPGRITNYAELQNGTEIVFSCRKTGGSRRLLVDRVINCTGSEVDCRRTEDPLLQNLLATGIARPGPLSLGLDVDAAGALLGRNGSSSSIYAIGPMRKGIAWETTAVPEIRTQAYELAGHLARQFQHHTVSLCSGSRVKSSA